MHPRAVTPYYFKKILNQVWAEMFPGFAPVYKEHDDHDIFDSKKKVKRIHVTLFDEYGFKVKVNYWKSEGGVHIETKLVGMDHHFSTNHWKAHELVHLARTIEASAKILERCGVGA